MLGIKVNSIKMNLFRIFIYFCVLIIIPIVAEGYKKINNEGHSYNEIKEHHEIVQRHSFGSNQQILDSEIKLNQKLYSKSRTEIVDISKEKNLINFGDGNKDILFVSTLDGYIHAIDSNNNELWKISLGKSLINSHLNNYNILEQNSIIPDLDGNIYLYSMQNDDKLTKIDIPIKTLIDSSPFTLPNIPNTIFLGDKKSSIYTIDIEKGIILSKISSSESSIGYINKKPIQTNNLLTVIRTDYTLSSFNQVLGTQSWNVTVSDIMAIQKGSKNEIAVNWKKENSNDLMGKISKLLENPNLNSIVSIHNYISDSNLPVKIYDNKKAFNPLNSDEEIDFETFLNLNKDKFFKNLVNTNDNKNNNFNANDRQNDKSNADGSSLPVNFIDKYNKSPYYFDPNDRNRFNNNEEIRINYDQIFRDYLNYTKNKLKENSKFFSPNGILGKIFYKFWELYYFDDYFVLYMSVFTILVGIIVLLIFIILRIRDKNNKLKDKLKLRKKSSDSIEEKTNFDNKSATNASEMQKDINEFSKDNDLIEEENAGEITCYQTDSGAICVYSENKNIQNLKKLIGEKINNDKIKRHKNGNSNKDLIIISNDNENSGSTDRESHENQKFLDMQTIKIHQEAKLNIINNKQFEELFRPQLELNLKNAEIQNKVESTFCFLKDTDGKIIKIENKQLITKYHDNPEVAERIMQVTGQIGLINMPDSKNITVKKEEITNDGVICHYNKSQFENTFAVHCNKSNGAKVIERKFSENIEFSKTNSNNFTLEFTEKNIQNSEEFGRAKSNDTKKPEFQPIQFSIKALREKEKTEFTFEKGTFSSSLGLGNASTDTNYLKYDSKSDFNTKDIKAKESSCSSEICKTENSIVLLKNIINNPPNNNNAISKSNKLGVNNEKSKTKFQISVKDRSKSKQRNGNASFLNNSNQKENAKNNNIKKIKNDKEEIQIKNSPADKKNKVIKLNEPKENLNANNNYEEQNRNNKHLCSTSKTNNLNLKCKYKEYKEFNIVNDPNEKNKLLKIDTTFIDEGRIGKNFEEFSKVGEGGFGSVFKAKHKIDGSLYAIKVIKLDVGISQSLKDHKVIKEVKTMMKLYHKNVVRYYTCWFQLNIDEIKNLKSESDEESHITSSCVSNSNNNLVFTNTIRKKNTNNNYNKNSSSNYSESFFGSVSNFHKSCVKKEAAKKQAFENADGFSEASRNKPYFNNYNNNNKIIKKINFNNVRDKTLNDSKCYESPEKSKKNDNTTFYNECYNTYNSKSKSVTRNNNNSYLNLYSTNTNTRNRKSLNPLIELNATKSAILNQISENGESDFNSKNQSEAGGFNWEDSNFLSKKNNESYEKSQMENSRRRGRSSENSKINISHNGNSFWNESKKDYIEKSIKHVNFTSNDKSLTRDNNNVNKIENDLDKSNVKKTTNRHGKNDDGKIDEQIRKFSSLTEEIKPDNNLYDKKAFSISLEKNTEGILSDSNDVNVADESYFSNEESKNNSKLSPYPNNKINNANENRNKNNKKLHAQDDSIIYLTNRNKKKKKEFVYNVYFLVQMEFCDGLSLNQYLEINKNNGLNRQTIFSFFKQILSGVNQIHKSNIIHRDLKPHNIFVIGENSLKIGDFGLAYDVENYARQKKLNNSNNKNANINNISSSNLLANLDNSFIKIDEFVGTPLYQSPEQIKELAYNEKVDIYAMGLILYEMCACFKTGMERRISIEKLRNENKIEDKINSKYSIESELILWMTRVKPSDRPSAQEILNSEKFKNWKKQFSD